MSITFLKFSIKGDRGVPADLYVPVERGGIAAMIRTAGKTQIMLPVGDGLLYEIEETPQQVVAQMNASAKR